MQTLGDIVMQLMERRKKRNEVISAGDLNRRSPMVADLLSKTMSASGKDLTQVRLNYTARITCISDVTAGSKSTVQPSAYADF